LLQADVYDRLQDLTVAVKKMLYAMYRRVDYNKSRPSQTK
jgi:hypothetical protein